MRQKVHKHYMQKLRERPHITSSDRGERGFENDDEVKIDI